jgi:hypothetical protein
MVSMEMGGNWTGEQSVEGFNFLIIINLSLKTVLIKIFFAFEKYLIPDPTDLNLENIFGWIQILSLKWDQNQKGPFFILKLTFVFSWMSRKTECLLKYNL